MNFIDLFIIVLLVWAVFRGFTRGFIMQLTMLVALALGIFGALKLSGFTARQLENRISINSEYLYLVSLGITFVLVFIGINLVGKLVEKIAESAEFSFINRMAGVLFSLSKTILILGILLAFIDRIDQQIPVLPKNSREQSIFYKPFTAIARTIFPSLGAKVSNNKRSKEFV
jgi:membrane protein required for colicin V production